MANMHLITGFGGSAHIMSADHGSFNAGIIGEGSYVLERGNKFAASVVTNNSIRVLDGDLLIQGRHARLNEGGYIDLTIDNGAQGMYRNDLIVARYVKDTGTGTESCDLIVIKGTESSSAAVDPAYSDGDLLSAHDLQVDFPLYRVPLSGLNVGNLVPLFSVVPTLASRAQTQTFLITASTAWTSDSVNGGYVQEIACDGILATDNPIYDVALSEDATANSAYLEAFANLTRITTTDGYVKLWCNTAAPSSAFPLRLQAVR